MTPSRMSGVLGPRPTTWLRWIGAATFVGGSLAFLVEGWTDESPVQRALLWGITTVVLTALSIVTLRRFRDPVGARVFLALAGASVPVHFVLLGAAVWSHLEEHTGSSADAFFVATITVSLAPVLALGISALVRRRARSMTSLLFLLSLPLVLPTRNPDVIAVLSVVELAILLGLELRVFRRDEGMQTFEGMTARALLFVPWALVLVRNAEYPVTDLWLTALIGGPALVCLALPHVSRLPRRYALLVQLCGAAGLFLAAAIASPKTAMLGLVLSSCGLVSSEVTVGRPTYLAWAGASLFAITAVVAAFEPCIGYALLVLPVGTLHALAAYRWRSGARLATCSTATLVGIGGQCVRVIPLPLHHLWVLAAMAGVLLVLLASIVDAPQSAVRRIWTRLQSHFVQET